MPASIRDRVARSNAWLRRHPVWFLLTFVALNGVRVTDFSAFRLLAAHPLALHPDGERQFLHGSPFTFVLGAPLAALLGTDAAWAIVTAAGFALLALAARRFLRRLPAPQAEIVFLVLASTPLLLVLTRWVGKSDPYLVGFYLLLVADPPRRWMRVVLAVAMVSCHREMGSIVLVVHLLCTRRDAAPILLGLAIGHGLLMAYWHALLPAPPQSRAQFAALRAGEILGSVAVSPLVHVVCALNWFWIFAAQLRRARDLVALVAILALAALALDFTRVVVLCALPIVLHTAVRVAADAALAAPLRRTAAFPLLFLIQFQIENAGRVHDWSWLR